MVLEGSTISVNRKLVMSTIGKGTEILSANVLLPKGQRFEVGENTTVYL